MIGMPVDNPVPARTAMSLFKTAQRCVQIGLPLSLSIEVSGVVTIGRDLVLDDFLQSTSDYLFWIDSDMVWEPEDFLRIVALATQVGVVCAAYPAKVEGPVSFYAKSGDELTTGPYGLLEIEGTGLGFTCISREWLEKLAATKPDVRDQITERSLKSVFRVDISEDGFRRTEDIAFFHDLRALGAKVWLDPQIGLGHIGERMWQGRFADAFITQEN